MRLLNAKNAYPNKYFNFRYGISSGVHGKNGTFGKIVIIFGANMSSSAHVNDKKDILIFGNGPTQRLDDTASAA